MKILTLSWLLALAACGVRDPAASLEQRFPGQAGRVLGGDGFARVNGRFVVRGPAGEDPLRAAEQSLQRRGGLQLALPAEAAGEATLSIPGGFSVRVREIGARGPGRLARNAVAYERAGGTSFWSATDVGYEEWLQVEVGEDGLAGEWVVSGARLRQAGPAAEIVAASGRAVVRVSAPQAFGSDGRLTRAWLEVAGDRLALRTEARGPSLVDPMWAPVAGMWTNRRDFTMTVLNSGKVLVAGGTDGVSVLASAEVFDPAMNTWTPTCNMSYQRANHTAALDGDSGLVLVAGGHNATTVLASAEIFDPNACGPYPYGCCGVWGPASSMSAGRFDHAAVAIPPISPSGPSVLIAGGRSSLSSGVAALASAELFDWDTRTWLPPTTIPGMTTARTEHTATLLSDNLTVLVVGGRSTTTYHSTWQALNLSTRTWSLEGGAGSPASARARHSATLLDDGRVLVAGGFNGSSYLASSQTFNTNATWSTMGSLGTARADHVAAKVLGANGEVVVTGGFNGSAYLATTQVFLPLGNGFLPEVPMGPMHVPRAGHSAAAIGSGRVLVAGGFDGTDTLAHAEVYDYLRPNWTTVQSMATARFGHSATLLPDKSVLVTGGSEVATVTPIKSAARYVYSAGAQGTWYPVANQMKVARFAHSATLLLTGDVLITGGTDTCEPAEVYLTSSLSFVLTPPMVTCHPGGSTATLLSDGRVLVVGGHSGKQADLYDPDTGQWSATGPIGQTRQYHTATLLPTGEVVVIGGQLANYSWATSAEIYSPSTNTWRTAGGAMNAMRVNHSATLLSGTGLPDAAHHILAAGGGMNPTGTQSAELFDPLSAGGSGTFSPTSGMAYPFSAHSAALLASGRVLLTNSDGWPAVFDPARGRWTTTTTNSLSGGYDRATLLPNNKVLRTGGRSTTTVHSRAEVFAEAWQPWAPSIAGYPAMPLAQRAQFTLSGSNFTGTDGSALPTITLTRQDSEQVITITPEPWPTQTSVTGTIPSSAPGGWYWLRVTVNGLQSDAVSVKVVRPVVLLPGRAEVLPGQTLSLVPRGGAGGSYSFWFNISASGGSLSQDFGTSSTYTGGTIVGAEDEVYAQDALGNVAASRVLIVAQMLGVTSPPAAVEAGSSCVTLSAAGGSGGYRWSMVRNPSGGTVDPATGRFCPGGTGSVTDVIRVTDSFGVTHEFPVVVAPPLVLSPTLAYTTVLGAISFSATGGGGAPFVWSVPSHPSGGTVSASGGYMAGSTGGATDTLTVADSLGLTKVAYVHVYNNPALASDRWVTRAARPTIWRGPSAVNVGDRLFVLGGANNGVLGSVEEYLPAMGSWTSRQPMTTARDFLSASEVSGKIYAIGGKLPNGAATGVVEIYNPTTNQWSSGRSMPTPRYLLATAVLGGKIYAIGGYNGSAILGTVEVYDPSTDQWTTPPASSNPLIPRYALAAATVSGKIYAFGGALMTNAVQQYDPTTNRWVLVRAMPTARADLSAVVGSNGKVYVIGGREVRGLPLATVEEYDPASDTWTTRKRMSVARAYVGAASLGNRLFVFGGSTNGTNGLDAVEEYVLPGGGGHADYDGDGKSDILWRSTSDGRVYAYLATGTSGTIFQPSYLTTQTADWQIVGQGDFNGDGKTDLIWRSTSLGSVYVYLATGSAGTATFQPGYLTTQTADWQIVGIGDFDGDGKSDILWRSTADGRVYAYLATGTSGTVFQPTYVTTQPADWQIVGLGDFNGDGKTDLIWRSTSLGSVYVYLATGSAGTATFQPGYLTTQTADWQIVGIGDFDGDGKSDILWRSTADGRVYAYLATGTTGTVFQPAYVTTQTPDWKIVGLGDYNGDGKTDLIWRSTSLGSVYVYVSTSAPGTVSFQPGYVTTQTADWQIVR